MHVNFLPEALAVAPTFVHFAPALGAAALTGVAREMIKIPPIAAAAYLRIYVE